MMQVLLQDCRYSLRVLGKSPGFTAVVVLILAIGIGASTAIFSVVNIIMLRPLPLVQPEELVACVSTHVEQNITRGTVAYPDYLDWKAQGDIFQSAALYTDPPFDLAGDDRPERVHGAAVSEGFFTVLSAPPLLGRVFLPEDHKPGSDKVVILSQSLWKRRFGSDPKVIGRTLRLSGDHHTVIGVMPATAQWPMFAALWVPLTFEATLPPDVMRRDCFAWRVIARLRADVSLPEARARVATIAKRIAQDNPDIRSGSGANLLPVSEFVVPSNMNRTLWTLMGGVTLVLLIACTNTANLMITRSAERSKEMAIRAALGAGRFQLVRLLLTEGVLLALLGGLLGLVLAPWGIDLLLAIGPNDIPRLDEIRIDGRVAIFALTLSLLTGLMFTLLPALHAPKLDLHHSLKAGGRVSSTTSGRKRLRDWLVAAEIAIAFVLLMGAGLMARSSLQLLRVDPSFQTDNLLTFRLSLPEARYPEQNTQTASFYEQALRNIRALPAVRSATAASVLPLAGGDYTHRAFVVDGAPTPPGGPEYSAAWNAVTPGYFATLGISLLKGRAFTDTDHEQNDRVIIINEVLARQMFPDENPIGKHIWRWRARGDSRMVVGVVQNVSFYDITDQNRPLVYVPHRQDARRNMVLAVRVTGDPMLLADGIRNAIGAIDKDLVPARLATMEQTISDFFARSRFITMLAGSFALVALVLALVGVYGVITYSINRRQHEFGVRMALGAQASNVLGLVMRQAVAVTLMGIAIGVLAAVVLAPTLSTLLYEVSATDPNILAGTVLVLSSAALVASYFPARRATKVDPMVALRCE